jgi:hypothetical protein
MAVMPAFSRAASIALTERPIRAVLLAASVFAAIPFAIATPPVVQTRRALDHLGQAALAWQAQFQCSGCHKQPITLQALGTALAAGHDPAPPGVVDALLAGTLEGTSGQDVNGCFSFAGGSGFTMATTYAGRGLADVDTHLRDVAAAVVAASDCLLARQSPDGRLSADSSELPVSQGDFVTTAHGAQVWKRAYERTGSSTYQGAAARAVAWLRGGISSIEAAPSSFTTQDKAMLLAGLTSAGAGGSDPDVLRMHALLASAQNVDGSWKIQSSASAGNGYGTGLAVFALRSAGFDASDPQIAGGRAWLLANQQPDGSWPASSWVGGTPSQVAPSMWGALALATFPSPLTSLRVSGSALSWSSVEGADGYDLIRGNVSSLATAAGMTDLGAVSCVAAATSAVSAADASAPAPGQALFYVFRVRWSGNRDIYGRASDGRDRVPLSGDCGP